MLVRECDYCGGDSHDLPGVLHCKNCCPLLCDNYKSFDESMLKRLQEKVVRLSLVLQGNRLIVGDEGLGDFFSIKDLCHDISILAELITLWMEDQEILAFDT